MITRLLSPEDLTRLRQLQVAVRHRVEGFCTGLHRSPHKGHSAEFREHRPYSKGDELRGIDWKVFGKTDRLFIRQYEEETNLRCHLVIDTSGSMGYAGERSQGQNKLQAASRFAAAMAYLMIQQQDSVGLVSFDGQIDSYLPPRSQAKHLSRLVDRLTELNASTSSGQTDRGGGFDLTSLVPKLRRGGLVVLLSDCFGDVHQLARSLAQFVQARNDVLVFQILDRDEMDFPFRQMAQFRSLENPSELRRVDAQRLRNGYLRRFAEFQQSLTDALAPHRIGFTTVTSDTSISDSVARLITTGSNQRWSGDAVGDRQRPAGRQTP